MARDAGGPAAPVCPSLPKCLAELFAACTPAGACTRQQLPAGASNTCWANGVRMLSAEVAGTTLSRVLRADRSVCYIVEQAGGGRNMPTTVTWRSAAGAPIATSTYTDMGRQLPVTCTGAMPQQVDQSCLNLPQQGGRGGGAGGCAQGACM